MPPISASTVSLSACHYCFWVDARVKEWAGLWELCTLPFCLHGEDWEEQLENGLEVSRRQQALDDSTVILHWLHTICRFSPSAKDPDVGTCPDGYCVLGKAGQKHIKEVITMKVLMDAHVRAKRWLRWTGCFLGGNCLWRDQVLKEGSRSTCTEKHSLGKPRISLAC